MDSSAYSCLGVVKIELSSKIRHQRPSPPRLLSLVGDTGALATADALMLCLIALTAGNATPRHHLAARRLGLVSFQAPTPPPSAFSRAPTPPLAFTPWAKITGKHCSNNKHATAYTSLESAQEACHNLGNECAGVYDQSCDEAGLFYACKPGDFSFSGSSCVYTEWIVHRGRTCKTDAVEHGTLLAAQEACLALGVDCAGTATDACTSSGSGPYFTCSTDEAFSYSDSSACVFTRGWDKSSQKHCRYNRHPQAFDTLISAQAACTELGSACAGVYDQGCDGTKPFYTCKPGEFVTSVSSCVFNSPPSL